MPGVAILRETVDQHDRSTRRFSRGDIRRSALANHTDELALRHQDFFHEDVAKRKVDGLFDGFGAENQNFFGPPRDEMSCI